MKVGFIGLGQMGFAMGNNLIKAGVTVTGYDVSQQALDKFAQVGGNVAPSLTQACQGQDVIITMLPKGDFVESVLNQKGGVYDSADSGTLLVDMSTVSPFETEKFAKDSVANGLRFLDAPVGRTSQHAQAGTLIIFAGCAEDAPLVPTVTPLFDALGETTIYMGQVGAGTRVKLVNNFMSIALNALSAEVINFSEKLELDYDKVQQVFDLTPAGNGHFKTTWPGKVMSNDLSVAFALSLAHKDLTLAQDVANRLGVPFMMGAISRELYAQAMVQGYDNNDWTAMLESYRKLSS